jgi:hypothetical protein
MKSYNTFKMIVLLVIVAVMGGGCPKTGTAPLPPRESDITIDFYQPSYKVSCGDNPTLVARVRGINGINDITWDNFPPVSKSEVQPFTQGDIEVKTLLNLTDVKYKKCKPGKRCQQYCVNVTVTDGLGGTATRCVPLCTKRGLFEPTETCP